MLSCFAPPGAVLVVGGSSDPRSPGVTLQEGRAAHEPLHPAVTSPPRLCWFCVWFLLGFSGMDVGYSDWFSWSLGLECCLVWCPLGPDPCMPRCWLSLLSLSLSCAWIVVGVVFFFLSFSGAGETQWDSRCVSSSWPRTTCSTRTSSPSPSPRSPPRLVFFFSSRRSRGLFFGFCSLCLVLRFGGRLLLAL